MKMTSAQAAKELRKLNDQHDALLAMENKAREFTAAIQENIETVRPAYDYAARQEELAALEEKTRKLKHAINTFNLQQEVPGFEMTIDQMLVYIPQLTARKKKLDYMRKNYQGKGKIPDMAGAAISLSTSMPIMILLRLRQIT